MDMSNFRPELHIAQQSRRDKLRVQQDLSPPHQHLGVYNANNLDQIYESSGLRNCRTGNLCYDSSEFCSEMMNPTSFNASSTVTTDQQYYTTWEANQGPIFVGEGSSRIVSTSHVSSSDGKAYVGFDQDLHSSSGYADMNSNSSLYHNALMQQLVSSSNARSFGLEFASLQDKGSGGGGGGSWVGGGNELVLLPAYADQWGGGETELGFAAAKDGDRDVRVVRNDHSNTQALSLSLSCKAQENQISAKDFPTVDVNCGNNPNLSSGSRVLRQQPLTHRNPGPLGPFTGYATILRSSKFLRPAQVLLEELCCIARPKDVDISDGSNKIFEEVRVSRDGVVSNAGPAMKGVAGNSSGSSFLINGSSDKGRDSPSLSFHQPENLQKKAKLLYMQDEVCKRYKQYHQQMQMVVSSFESVAGLTAATPFVSLALKMISKHFRSLKNAITDQLKSLKNALGEESSPMSSKGDATNVSMLKLFDQNYDHKDKGSSLLESQHIWRPQRGLPERAVSILRAWLFDHFLHPYPTDTDKHMLATQTGLTRNQVSNWFINARVRVWKPMVEEIHMLETKGVSTEAVSDADGGKNIVADKQVGCSRAGSTEEGRANPGVWSQEKRSRNEYHVPDGVFVGGLGSVSLTLGLRQGEENGARPVMQQERLLRPHYGGQVVREFVG